MMLYDSIARLFNYLRCVDMDTFAKRLRHYRNKAKYSQKELAKIIGVGFATYNNYETKGYEPKIEILIKLANALGIDVNTLVGFHEHEALLSVLRSASINFKMDPMDDNALYVENCFDDSNDKDWYMEIAAHLTFDDLKTIIHNTQEEMEKLTGPIFYRVFQDELRKFKITAPYDPSDLMVWPPGVEHLLKEDLLDYPEWERRFRKKSD